MKADKIRELDEKELESQIAEGKEQMFRLRFLLSMGQTDGVKKYRVLRRDRARMLTVQNQRRTQPAKAKEGK